MLWAGVSVRSSGETYHVHPLPEVPLWRQKGSLPVIGLLPQLGPQVFGFVLYCTSRTYTMSAMKFHFDVVNEELTPRISTRANGT